MKYFLSILLITNIVVAQKTDFLFNKLLETKGRNIKYSQKTENNINTEKCGFPLIVDIKLNFNKFTPTQQNVINNILTRPERQTSIVSPQKHFRIHYDTTGANAPDYYNGVPNTIKLSIDSLAIALDSAYHFEINLLGFLPPPSDGTDGGDELYDVYISNMGSGYYGWTNYTSIGNGKAKSYIEIDNNMDVYSKGIAGARVTAAHEFHHAIQVGNYREPISGDKYYFELTSTSMEEFVFDDINDYYNYLPTYFHNPDRRFTYNVGGYDRVIWNIFLKEKFEHSEGTPKKGFEIIRRTWEIMRNKNNSAIKAVSIALSENGLSLKNTFAEFSCWVYFTGNRAKPDFYFTEGENYPLIKPFVSYKYEGPKKTYHMSVQPMANNFILFDLSSSGINDTLFSIISNSDIKNAEADPHAKITYEYSLLTKTEEGSNEIAAGYHSKITSNNIEFLKEKNVFNNVLINGNNISRKEIDYAYPQPFDYLKHNFLFFPAKLNEKGTATLAIYSAGMNLVYNGEKKIYNNEKVVVRWDGKDFYGNKLSTGIYIYVTNSNGNVITGKIAIINK